jgi:hypothetical protein
MLIIQASAFLPFGSLLLEVYQLYWGFQRGQEKKNAKRGQKKKKDFVVLLS